MGLVTKTRIISKTEYDKVAHENNGVVQEDDYPMFFSPDLIMGYGIYSAKVTTANGLYYLTYTRGDSCD